ncbi:MAG TPA: type II toxin-antitoxin system RelE/ParE family toxin [Verrucomicrobiota bacterium]|nr:type II toxin-antitoxin system RelE/ParE family toxin [Verrucomicrobiota bacterium]
MSARWEKSEFIFCDLQAAARNIHRVNPPAAKRFLIAAHDTFEFLARNPEIGRRRADLGFAEVRSWRVKGFRSHLIFYRKLPDCVQIWRVLHGARDLETELGK